jgi:hypothetical protein
MFRELRIASLCFILAPLWGAEPPAERGKRVVNEALQALGGSAFLNVRDRLETGRAYSFYRAELSGLSVARIYTRYAAEPVAGKVGLREREAFFSRLTAKEEDAAVLFTEDGGWDLTYRGARPLEDQRYQNFQTATTKNIFYILRMRLNEPGLEFYSMGTGIFENRPVEIVEITDSARDVVTVYFSQSDKLPMRQSFKRRNLQLKDYDTEVSIFSKYRDVGGGVKWPLNIRRERNGEKIFEMFSDTVEINKGLTDDLFNIPVGMKALPKPK